MKSPNGIYESGKQSPPHCKCAQRQTASNKRIPDVSSKVFKFGFRFHRH